MFDRRLLGLWVYARGLIGLNVVLGLAVTACYAAQGLAVAEIVGQVFRGPDWPTILLLVGLVVVIQVIRAGLLWAREVSGTAAAGAVKQAVRSRLYRRLLDLGPGYLSSARTGAVQTTLVDAVEFLDKYVGLFLPQLVVSLVGAAALAAYLTTIDPVVGAVVIVCAVLVPLVPRVMNRVVQGPLQRWLDEYYHMAAESLDAIQGMTTLKACNAQERKLAQLRAQWQDNGRAAVRLVATAGGYEALVGVAITVGTALSVGIGALRLAQGQLTVTELLIILLLSRECFRPLGDLQRALHSSYQAPAAADGIFALLGAPPVTRAPAAVAVPEGWPGRPSLVFEQVSFRYRPDAAPVLDDLSFSVAPGETVAVVGRSGAGKTTLVALLLRFFDAGSGTVSIGGTDVRHIPPAELRRQVAVVAQDTYLFHGSVADNLRLARPEATQAELEVVAQAAHAHEFITGLPQGYHTMVGERGLTLSGGERQRLAIARPLLVLLRGRRHLLAGAAPKGPIEPQVRFDRVSFRYDPALAVDHPQRRPPGRPRPRAGRRDRQPPGSALPGRALRPPGRQPDHRRARLNQPAFYICVTFVKQAMATTIGFRPTDEDERIITAAMRPDERTSDVIRRALRLLERDVWPLAHYR